MASTYSTDLKLELMVTGENAGTWGDKTNSNLNLIQQAIAGYQAVSIAGGSQTTALTMSNAALSDARNMVIEFTGAITGNQTVTVPNGIEKYYILKNSTTGSFTVTFKYASTGSGITLTQGYLTATYGNGTDFQTVDLTTLQGTLATAQITNLAVTSGKLASFAVTSARLASYAVTSTRLATNAVTAVKITQSTITQAKLAANSVGTNQLINTSVTAGSYTAASITVDAKGRITSASSGSAGAGMGIPNLMVNGPTSGTYTATSNANRLGVYMFAGGGGAGGGLGDPFYQSGGPGGPGGYGFYNKPISQPFSQPYSIGGAGNGANWPGGGSGGGATNFTNVGTVNGGSGGNSSSIGNPGNTGSSGNAPGAYYVPANKDFVVGRNFGDGGSGQAGQGSAGSAGALAIFENTGT